MKNSECVKNPRQQMRQNYPFHKNKTEMNAQTHYLSGNGIFPPESLVYLSFLIYNKENIIHMHLFVMWIHNLKIMCSTVRCYPMYVY